MRVLVTGGLGVNGAWVTRELIAHGHSAVVFDSGDDPSLLGQAANGALLLGGDVLDLPALVAAAEDQDCIVHLAALVPGADPEMIVRVNTHGTANVMEAARRAGVQRVVLMSSKAVYGPLTGRFGHPTYDPVTEDHPRAEIPAIRAYSASKIAAEDIALTRAREFRLEFAAVRAGTVYAVGKSARHAATGTASRVIENALMGRPTILSKGADEADDFVFVQDVARGLVAACAAEHLPHWAYNIGSGSATRFGDFVETIRHAIPGSEIQIGPGLDPAGMGPVYGLMDITRAKKDLGFTPRYDVREGIAAFIAAHENLVVG